MLHSMTKERVRQDLETEKQQQSSNFGMIFLSYHKESHIAGSPKDSALTDVNEWVPCSVYECLGLSKRLQIILQEDFLIQ